MARHEKHTVDYFPFVVKDGKTLHILEGKYGCKGSGFFTNVLRFLCETPDHYYCIQDEADRMYFFSRVKCDAESGLDMLDIMSKTGKISRCMWISGSVIVSGDLLASLKDAYSKRSNPIITIKEIEQKFISGGINTEANEFPGEEIPSEEVSGVGSTQTKLKETKLKKKKNIVPSPETDQSGISIFQFWNDQQIIIHKDIEKFKGPIMKALEVFSLDEIKEAITNYRIVLEGGEYFWTYRWTLKEFLQRGIEKFLTRSNPLENFLTVKNGKATGGQKTNGNEYPISDC